MQPTASTGFRLDDGQFEVVDQAVADIMRQKTPAEKVAMVGAAHRTAKRLMAAGIRRTHPNWSDDKVQDEVIRRLLHGTN
ncbi:MAG: hypothetical protein IAG10_26850 [Planctomycetaceae bacterium]|nr:hypothetical protein [Planctomycetaceae bacterium]